MKTLTNIWMRQIPALQPKNSFMTLLYAQSQDIKHNFGIIKYYICISYSFYSLATNRTADVFHTWYPVWTLDSLQRNLHAIYSVKYPRSSCMLYNYQALNGNFLVWLTSSWGDDVCNVYDTKIGNICTMNHTKTVIRYDVKVVAWHV